MRTIIDILVPLTELASEHRESVEHLVKDMSAKQWLKEHCTIRLAGPRGSGHTHAMVACATEYPTGKMCLVTGRDRFLVDLRKRIGRAPTNSFLISAEHPNWLDQLRGREFEYVIFDTAGQFPRYKLEEMYDLVAARISAGDFFLFMILG